MPKIPEVQTSLEPTEQARLVNAIGALIHIHRPEQFLKWTKTELQSILPHGMLMCGIGRIGEPGILISRLSVNFPLTYDEESKQPDEGP